MTGLVYYLLEGDDRAQVGIVSRDRQVVEQAAVACRDADTHYEGYVCSIHEGAHERPWLHAVYYGSWMCSFYQHEPVERYDERPL